MYRFWTRGPLRDAAGDAGAGGGGAGGSGAPPAVTIEAMNKAINDALARMKKTDIPKAIEDALKPVTDGIGTLTESLKPLLDKSGGGQGGDGGSGGGSGDGTKVTDPQVAAKLKDQEKTILKLSKDVETLTQNNADANKRADQADRNSQLNEALAGFAWLDKDAQSFAFRSFAPDIKRTDDGTLVIGELPLKKAIEDQMGTRALQGLLAPKQTAGGSGAGSQGGAAQGGPSAITLDSIKPGMTKEQTEATLAELRKHVTR